MRSVATTAVLVSAVLVSAVLATDAQAQTLRSAWVASTGADANACSFDSPCRTFAGALGKVAARGLISCKDGAEYGGMTIDKPVTVACDGSGARIVHNNSGDAVTISVGANDAVMISGVDFFSSINSASAIRFTSGRALTVKKGTIAGFGAGSSAGSGVTVDVSSGTAAVVIDGMAFADGGTIGSSAIYMSSTGSAVVTATLTDVRVSRWAGGLTLAIVNGGRLVASVTSSSFVDNRGPGIVVGTNAYQGAARATLKDVRVTNNATGLKTTVGPTAILVGDSVIADNGIGIQAGGRNIYSFGGNIVSQNGGDETFSGTAPRL